MKPIKWSISVFAALILLLQGQSGTALAEHTRWNTFGPIGPVSIVAIDPRNSATLYASNYGPLFKSTDKGANWRVVNSEGSPSGGVYRIVVDPHSGDVYAASGPHVFKSTDAGINWTVLKMSSSGFDLGFWNLTFDTRNPGVVYAGSADEDAGAGALLKSTDSGATWRRLPLSNLAWGAIYIYSVIIDPQNSEIVYATSYDDVYQSLDGGATWKGIVGDLVKGSWALLAIDPQSPTTLFVGTRGGVFKSIDRGGSWSPEPVLPATQVRNLKFDPRDPSTLYASIDGSTGLNSFKSQDRGASWTAISGFLPHVFAAAWDPQNPDTIYRTGNDGLFKSADAGTSWRRLHSGLTTMNVSAVAVDPQNPGSAYAFTSSRVFKTADGGRRWNVISSAGPGNRFGSAFAIDPQTPTTIYTGSAGGVSKSTDGGKTWQPPGEGLGGSVLKLAIDAQNPSTMYAHVYFGFFGNSLFKSTNGGANWSEMGFRDRSITPPDKSVSVFAVNPHNSQILYVGAYATSAGPLYRSTDGGSTWTNVTLPRDAGSSVSTFAFDQDAARVYTVLNCNRLFKSTDAGASFTQTGALIPSCAQILLVDPKNPDVMYAAGGGGVYRSKDGGANWIRESDVPPTSVWSMALDSSANKLYAAVWGSGVFATFDSLEAIPVPTLTLDSAEYCIGQSWTLKVSGARADTLIRLHGVSNAQLWEIAEWNKTDANGSYEERGTLSELAEGPHLLYVEIDGASSNDIVFRVFNCSSKR